MFFSDFPDLPLLLLFVFTQLKVSYLALATTSPLSWGKVIKKLLCQNLYRYYEELIENLSVAFSIQASPLVFHYFWLCEEWRLTYYGVLIKLNALCRFFVELVLPAGFDELLYNPFRQIISCFTNYLFPILCFYLLIFAREKLMLCMLHT